jgi:hypothetical protein
MDSEKLPLIVRFACLPNQYSVPSFYIDTATDLPTVLHKVKEAISGDISIVTVMVQHATPRNKIPEKIVGRVRYEDDFSSPNEIVLELYKGSRTMRIFDTVSSTDNAFASFVKPHGGFMRPELRAVNCKISGGDIQDIMYDLETRYKEKIQLARKVFLRLASKKSPIVSLEFWYLDGEMTFADFD